MTERVAGFAGRVLVGVLLLEILRVVEEDAEAIQKRVHVGRLVTIRVLETDIDDLSSTADLSPADLGATRRHGGIVAGSLRAGKRSGRYINFE